MSRGTPRCIERKRSCEGLRARTQRFIVGENESRTGVAIVRIYPGIGPLSMLDGKNFDLLDAVVEFIEGVDGVETKRPRN